MTAMLERPAATTLPERIPAWGVSVDLTPREIVQGRQTRVVQRLVALGLVVVLLGCGGLALLADNDRTDAHRAYDDAQSQTQQLKSASHDFDGLVALQQVTKQTNAQAALLMTHDVDFVNAVARIRAALPADVTISSLSVTLAPETADGTDATTGATASTAQPASIGTITIGGGGPRIKALAPFVARLNHMHGITDVVPTSTTQTDLGMVYSLTMSYTDELYTHRFDTTDQPGAAQ